MGVWAEALVAELDGLARWPAPHHREALDRVGRGIALRSGDEQVMRHLAGWNRGRRLEQRFVHDPMPSRMSTAFSGLIFGRQPAVEPANASDAARMEELVKDGNLRSELGRAARAASSEGEVWWRVYRDLEVADHPILEWLSRTAVYPLWRGWRLLAVAFVSRLDDLDDGHTYRYFEVHDRSRADGGAVRNVLYAEPRSARGTDPDSATRVLGERVSLSQHPETENMAEEWRHGLPTMLGGRVANLLEDDPTLGVSDYHDPEDWLVELDVIASIAHANLELVGRRRAIVPESQVDPETGDVDTGEQLYTAEALERTMGQGAAQSGAAFKVLEYRFDAEALIAWKREVERTALNRVGIDAQYAGVDPAEGRADTGVALRIKLIPSIAAGEERAQEWDQQLPLAVRAQQLLESLPLDQGGFGRPWAGKGEEPPTVDRGATLPEDRSEATERRASAVGANIMSRRRAVEEDMPDAEETEVDAELREIERDARLREPAFGATIRAETDGGGGPPGAGVGEEA